MTHASLQTIREEHVAIRTVLQSLATLVEQGPADEPVGFFDALRAMLFYLEEFPERLHHANESTLLFPKVVRAAPELAEVVRQLDSEHADGITQLRRLHSLVLARSSPHPHSHHAGASLRGY